MAAAAVSKKGRPIKKQLKSATAAAAAFSWDSPTLSQCVCVCSSVFPPYPAISIFACHDKGKGSGRNYNMCSSGRRKVRREEPGLAGWVGV